MPLLGVDVLFSSNPQGCMEWKKQKQMTHSVFCDTSGKEGCALHFVLQHTRRAMTLKPLFLLPSLFVNLLSISVYTFGARQTAVVNADLLDAVLEKASLQKIVLADVKMCHCAVMIWNTMVAF